MHAQKWRDDLVEAIGTYSQTRQRTPSVKITLVDGDVRYLMTNALVEGPRGEHGSSRVTPDVLVVEPTRIAKVELLYEPPEGRRGVGFQAPVDDVR